MINLSFSKLDSKKLFTLALRIKEILETIDAVKLGISLFFSNFLNAFTNYTKSMEYENVSARELAQKDNVRDDMLIALRSHIKNYLYYPDEDVKTKTQALLKEIDSHGKQIYNQDYKTQTASVEQIISSFSNSQAEFLQVINANVWFNFLKTAQIEFEAALHSYSANKADDLAIMSVTEARPALVKSLRKLFAFLPMQYELTQDETLGNTIAQINVEVDRF